MSEEERQLKKRLGTSEPIKTPSPPQGTVSKVSVTHLLKNDHSHESISTFRN